MLPPHSMLRMGSDLKMKPEVWQAKEWTNNNLEHSPGPDQKAAKNVLAEIALKKKTNCPWPARQTVKLHLSGAMKCDGGVQCNKPPVADWPGPASPCAGARRRH